MKLPDRLQKKEEKRFKCQLKQSSFSFLNLQSSSSHWSEAFACLKFSLKNPFAKYLLKHNNVGIGGD